MNAFSKLWRGLLSFSTSALLAAAFLGGGFLIFFLAGSLARGPGPADETDETGPLVEAVIPEAIGDRFTIVEEGFLRPIQTVGIVPEVSGKIVAVDARLAVGGAFKEGDVLFEIDPVIFDAELKQAEANLAAAEAALTRAKADFERQNQLAKDGNASGARLDQSRADMQTANADVERSRASVIVAQDRLSDTKLRAPFEGRIQSEDVSVGQYVSPGVSVATFYDTTAGEILLGLSPPDAAAVRRAFDAEGASPPVTVRPTLASATTASLEGRIVEFASALDQQSRTVTVVVRIDGAFSGANDGRVYAEDFLEVELPARSVRPLYTASAAVIRRQDFVWKVTPEGTLDRVSVTPLRRTGDKLVFAAETDLRRQPLLATALTEERQGLSVRLKSDKSGASERPGQDAGA